ncbi:MAG: hypothetical protein ACLQU1_34300 [Bryobacteraceae bacterium]
MSKTKTVWGMCALVALLFFWLPYHVPASYTIDSLSARVGFNNQAAIIIMLAGLLVLTLLRLAERHTPVFANEPAQSRAIPNWLLILAIAAVTIHVLFIAWITDGTSHYGEETYFLSKLLHMQAGHTPYRDFEFAYGPALVYLPYWCQVVFGLSAHFAYCATVWLFAVAGIFLLWALLRFSGGSRWLFVVLLSFFLLFTLQLDLQYTLLRYISGFGALLAIEAVSNRFAGWWPIISVTGAALTVATVLVSPEIGIAFAIGLLAYMAIEILRGSHRLLWAVAGYALIMGCLLWLLPGGMFQAVTNYSSGFGSFPLLPSPYMLLYVGSLLWVIPFVCASVLWSLRFGGTPRLPFGVSLTGAFAVNAVALMPGALGRADAGHVFLYGFGVFLLALVGAGLGGRWRSAYLGLFTAILFLVAFSGTVREFPSFRSQAGQKVLAWAETHPDSAGLHFLEKLAGGDRWGRLEARLRRVREMSVESNYPELSRYGRICVPYVEGIEGEFVLAKHGNLGLEYYHGRDGVDGPAQVRRKIDGLRTCSYVVIATEVLSPAGSSWEEEEANDVQVMKRLLMCPFPPGYRGARLPNPPRRILEYIAAEYEVVERLNARLTLCKRRTAD